MVCLEPPGNVAREIARFRRRVFSETGEPSAVAFPEVVPLAFSTRPGGSGRSLAIPSGIWDGVSGSFETREVIERGDGLYLRVDGPLRVLASRAAILLSAMGAEPILEPPLACGLGFFLRLLPVASPSAGLSDLPAAGAARDSLADPLAGLEPPRSAFGDSSLLLVRLTLGPEPFVSARWLPLASAPRRGRRGNPSSSDPRGKGPR